ncbi:phenylalanine 4-monooxygenase [Neptunicella sp. SCSIO 80796]|uniref:phenylalanine 4-monooxygenase n=1 Tax=Neptunicella plasticusilytica TaxID=3117012 RepID=UPI003A4DCBA3
MSKESGYVSRLPDSNGIVHWTTEENAIWQELLERQLSLMEGRACDEFLRGLELLNLPQDRVPQLHEVNAILAATTGWKISQVPALIDFDEFFRMLANKEFPVATFIRSREEFDYLREPDVFHEIFGHCPLLTNPDFAHFTHTYGKLGYQASKQDRSYLARLYWFTVEFGLLDTPAGQRIYGGGILSSPGETVHALQSEQPERLPMNVLDALRTPYRIDIMQPVYYSINGLQQLHDIAELDIMDLVEQAKALGLHPAKFPPKQKMAS